MNGNVLIAGIGNIFLGDDAFGSVVARRMLTRAYPPEVQIIDFGIRGFDLAFALLNDYAMVILVDAYPHNAEPGSVRMLEIPIKQQEECAKAMPETHGIAPTRALQFARQFGLHAEKIFLIGCEPETLEPNQNGEFCLSPPVAAAVEPAIELIDGLLTPVTPGFSRVGQRLSAHDKVCTN